MAESDDAVMLRRRARRRLVGAVALALFIVIVLPIVFDKEPKPITQDLVIEIPSQDPGRFNPRLLPQAVPAAVPAPAGEAAAKAAEAAKAGVPDDKSPAVPPPEATAKPGAAARTESAAAVESAKPGTSGKTEPAAKAEPAAKTDTPAPAVSEGDARRAQAILDGESFIVPLGAYSNAGNAKQVQSRVNAAGYKSYSEKFKGAKGEQLRVRAGPFTSREAAEGAREKLKSMGLNPVGAVVAREQP